MDLSRSIVRDFVEITNDSDTSKPDTTVYGTIVEYNGQTYAQIDGADSDILTPISATVDVKTGERVLVTIKNHTATVTGNLDDPSAGRWRVDELGNMIFESVVTFESLENGTTVINGGCIKTGKIEAQYLNLTGAITFDDLSDETKDAFTIKYQYSSDGENWHDTRASDDIYRREYINGEWGDPYQFVGKNGTNGSDASIPTYITQTVIGKGMIQAPQIYANDISLYPNNSTDYTGSFNIYGMYGTQQYHMFAISYEADPDEVDTPYIRMFSPAGGYIEIGRNLTGGSNNSVSFFGEINFANADFIEWGSHAPSSTATFA